jgi:hypothetical protein
MEKMPHGDAADFCLVARSGGTADSGKATVMSEIRVGELEGANGAVLEPGICPPGNGRNASCRGVGAGGIEIMALPSAENVGGSARALS